MHLDDERLQRLLHGELSPAVAAAVREHVATCVECRARVAVAEDEESDVLELLRELDHAPPKVRVEDVLAASRGRARRWTRWVAAAAIAIAAASAAYALPGSPLRALASRAARWLGDDARVSPPAPASTTGGVAIPVGARLEIVFAALQPEGLAIVSLGDGERVEVRASGGEAAFNAGVARLEIHNAGSTAVFRVDVPHSAPDVRIVVAERELWRKEGAHIVTDAPRDGDGRYLLSLSGRR